jgi:beta-lactamase regulating signal transducer with metallopeptidase domain
MSPLLLELVVKSSLLIVAAGAIDLLMRRRGSAASRHLVWTLAVSGLLILPAFLLAIPRWQLRVPIVSAVEAAPPQAALTPASSTGNQPSPLAVALTAPRARSAHDNLRTSGFRPFVSASPALIVLGIYAAGVALFIARLALQRRAARRLVAAAAALHGSDWSALLRECVVRLDMRETVHLLRSCEQTVPMTFGTRTPTILVPAAADTWNDDKRRAVLLHELAHIVRRDCATQMAAAVACAVYWFHPGVWWAANRMRREREIACDDRVVAAGTQPTDYAGHLLELAYTCIGSRTPAVAVSMARPSEIEGRLRSLLDAARNRSTPAPRTRMWSAVAAIAVIGLFAAVRATLVPVQAQSPRSLGEGAAATNLIASSQQARRSEPRPIDAGARSIAEGGSGTWQMWVSDLGIARVQLSDRAGSWHSFETTIANLEAQFKASIDGGYRTMQLARDAGTFTFEGVVKARPGPSTVGAGTFTFTPSGSFPTELTKRGFQRPTALDQYLLARSDVGFAFIDELAAQDYTRPDLATLVRASEHGVTLSHLREMGRLGYRLQRVDALITQVDHGVTPDFVRELADLRFKNLTADDLVRTRDHGVDAGYIKELGAQGYNVSSAAEAIRARDHGVDVEYIRSLRQLGYRLTLEETITARDHGVDTSYIRDLTGFGYSNLPMDQLIRTRDHGVDSDYIRELRQLGYQTSLPELITARDHGVDPEYIRGLAVAGYKGLSLEQLIRLRDHGVDPEFVKTMKRSGVSLSPDDLVRLRDAGPITDRLVDNVRGALAQWSARIAMWRGRLAL